MQVKKSVKKCVIYRNMNRKSAKNRFQKSNKKQTRPKKVLKKVPKKELKKKDGHKKCTKKFTYKVIRLANLRGAPEIRPLHG